MPSPPSDPIAALADEAVDFALRHHPHATARVRRIVARLYIKTRLHPSARTTENLATLFGIDRRRIPEIEATALAKLRARLLASTNPNPNPNPNHTPS
jgi:DNA-directed RNA polymerase sigma subunit (sigma70/sigma32)